MLFDQVPAIRLRVCVLYMHVCACLCVSTSVCCTCACVCMRACVVCVLCMCASVCGMRMRVCVCGVHECVCLVCACMCVCVCMCVPHLLVCRCASKISPQSLSYFLRHSLSLDLELTFPLDWLAIKSQGVYQSLSSSAGVTDGCCLCVGAGTSNSGLHVCIASHH